MMDVFEAIEKRRSVKAYDPDFRMPKEDVDKMFDAVRLAPTAFNIQNWRFVVVNDKALRAKIRAAAWDQAQVTDASLLVVLCGDLKSWEKEPRRYWREVPSNVRDVILPMIDNYYRGRDQVMRDEVMRSCGIAAQTLMLAATAMGYQCCPMDGFDFDAVGKLINLPDDHAVTMFVAIGKGIKPPSPRSGALPADDVLIEDRF